MLYSDVVGSDDRAAKGLEIRHALTTAPTLEPVTLAEIRKHCRIDDEVTGDDEYLSSLVSIARRWIEDMTGRAFCTQTRTFYIDEFPPGWARAQGARFALYSSNSGASSPIYLPRPPLISITSIGYIDTAGTPQSLVENTDFKVDRISEPARIAPAYSKSWPSTRAEMNAVTIIAQCGYGVPAAVPGELQLAIKMLALYWFENREAAQFLQGASVSRVPYAVRSLTDAFKVRRFG